MGTTFVRHRDENVNGKFFNTLGGMRLRLSTQTHSDNKNLWKTTITVKKWASGRFRGSSYADIGRYVETGFHSRQEAKTHGEQKFDQLKALARSYEDTPDALRDELTHLN